MSTWKRQVSFLFPDLPQTQLLDNGVVQMGCPSEYKITTLLNFRFMKASDQLLMGNPVKE